MRDKEENVLSILFPDSLEKKNRLRIAWTTDLHLDALDKESHRRFFTLIAELVPDIVLIGGDISNGVNSLAYLKRLASQLKIPCYFVWGNHDFYHESIRKIRFLAQEVSQELKNICYLTGRGAIPLTPVTALVGHDGWSDGRAGDFIRSSIMLNDYALIDELKNLTKEELLHRLNQLGAEAARETKKAIQQAFQTHDYVIFLTHPPPFRECCFYQGHLADDEWAPHFVCQAVGEILYELAKAYPQKQILTLCGHSHSGSDVRILPNLRVIAGESSLGKYRAQGLIEAL